MKTILLVARRHGVADFVSDFHSHVKGQHQILAAAFSRFAERKGRREHWTGNVKRRTGIVIVIRVNRNAVGQRGKAGMHFHFRADDAGPSAAGAERLNVLADARTGSGSGSGQR